MKKCYFVFMIIIFLTGLLVRENLLFSGTTGKIAGVIVDSATKNPLPGANIVLEGTTMGAATDVNGNYIILNVPPGAYTLRASMMGYKTHRVEDVRVKIDMTITINFALEATVLEVGEEITVVAERPLVQRDMTSSLTSVGSQEIAALPVQEFRDVLELQAGIVRSGNDLHIRGGRAGEVAYWVDGVATTDLFSGGSGVTVENSAIEELQVVSGTFNAEYGQAMSGIINIITKEGGQKYTGQVKAYVGDFISDDKSFRLLKSVATEKDPATGKTITIGDMENPLRKFNPIYNAEFSLSGPVPLLGDKLSFFTNGRYYSTNGHLYGREWFTPLGTAGDSSLVPLNPFSKTSAQGKLSLNLSANLKVSYNLFWNNWANDRIYYRHSTYDGTVDGHNFKYTPGGLPQELGGGTSHILAWNHVLSPSTFYEIRVNRFYNEYKRYVYEDPHAMPKYLVQVYPDTVRNLEGKILDPSIPAEAEEFNRLKQERRDYEYIIAPDSPLGYVHPDSAQSAPTSDSFYKVGMDMEHYKRSTAFWVGKFDLTSQINAVNQVEAGVEFRQHELTLHSYTLRPKMRGAEQIVPFEPDKPEVGSIYRHDYNQTPREISAYVQDKIELKDIIFRLGLRFDYFDANSTIPTDPTDPNIYDPFYIKNRYKDAPESLSNLVYKEDYDNIYTQYDPEERRAFMQKKVAAKMQLSPRLGIAYPITNRGVIHFSYGHFFQIPEFQYLYDNPDFKLSPSGGYTIFGNPDLKPQKTVMYEIGLQQQLTENIAIDATLFYRDVRDWVGTSPLIDTPIPSVKYSQYENKDYENVRGVTLKVEKRYSNNFSARLDYSYQVAEGTYSNPNDAYDDISAKKEPRKTLVPMNWDQNHTLNGSIVYRVSNWTISMIGRYWTGRPYTPEFVRGEVLGSAAYSGLKENSSRLPSQKSVDLYINKQFQLSSLRLELFMNVYNLFDQKDETSVYGDTGSADYTTTIDPLKIPYNPKRIGTIEDYVNQAGWYTEPRQVQVGLIIGF
jgi:outer membrane receptor protein involved in Fe transport